MNFGPRRPDWGRTGKPSRREMAEMLAYRRHVLDGFHSLPIAVMSAGEAAQARAAERKDQRTAQAFLAGCNVAAPPPLPDDL